MSTTTDESVLDDVHGSPENANAKAKTSSTSKVRRRNRMITSCLECRRRKLKCDKLHPCTNCNKFSRDCMFLAPALDSVSQQRLNEIKDKMGSLEKVLEEDVAKKGRRDSKPQKDRKSSIDLPGEESSSDDDAPVPEDEQGLEPTPLAVVDASYEDDANDDVLDLGVRIGKMRMTERLGGFFRPKMSEELDYTLQNPQMDQRTTNEKMSGMPQLPDDAHDFLEPGPTYIPPGTGLIFGDMGSKRNLIEYLPAKEVADLLITTYYENVHFLARVVHWPSFQVQYDNFWISVLSGLEPPASQQAIVLAIMFSAVASMPETDLNTIFARPKSRVLANFQKGTEVALSKAQVLRTTKIETVQAFVAYLIPMCRDQMSRAHSVLVGTAIRLAECLGMHRDPADVYGLPPIECQVRRTVWFQLCFLDFRTGEVHGPRPCIKREDYDTRFPLNIDDADLMSGKVEESSTRFTDMTLSRIRFECNEMHRIIWYDRLRLEKRKITLTHLLGKIESFRKAMLAKYSPILDTTIPIQHYAHTALRLLLNRMNVMVLHRYVNNYNLKVPDRLREVCLTGGVNQTAAAVELEKEPNLHKWRWYNGAHQQWHTAFLLLVEVYRYPNRREADRIWEICDFVFEPDTSLSRTQKARTIMAAVKDRIAVYRDMRRMRAPVSMRSEDVRKVYVPQSAASKFTASTSPMPKPAASIDLQRGSASPPTSGPQSIDAVAQPKPDSSWNFESPSTLLFAKNYPDLGQLPGVGQNKQRGSFDTSPFQQAAAAGGSQFDYTSPSHQSESSGSNEPWPPFISNGQNAWRPANITTSPPQPTLQVPGDNMGYPQPGMSGLQQMYPADTPAPQMPFNTPSDDAMMPDIDWVSVLYDASCFVLTDSSMNGTNYSPLTRTLAALTFLLHNFNLGSELYDAFRLTLRHASGRGWRSARHFWCF